MSMSTVSPSKISLKSREFLKDSPLVPEVKKISLEQQIEELFEKYQKQQKATDTPSPTTPPAQVSAGTIQIPNSKSSLLSTLDIICQVNTSVDTGLKAIEVHNAFKTNTYSNNFFSIFTLIGDVTHLFLNFFENKTRNNIKQLRQTSSPSHVNSDLQKLQKKLNTIQALYVPVQTFSLAASIANDFQKGHPLKNFTNITRGLHIARKSYQVFKHFSKRPEDQ